MEAKGGVFLFTKFSISTPIFSVWRLWVGRDEWFQKGRQCDVFREKIDLSFTLKLKVILKVNSVKYIVKNILASELGK